MWVDVAQGRLYVDVVGSGPPLLMVHGWTLDHRMFEPQVRELSSALRIIVYDRRGFGKSQAPPDLRLELDDIDRILDALELRTVHLLGVSQGGRVAIRYAVTRQHRLRSLILQGAVIDGLGIEELEAEQVPMREYAALARAGRLDEVRQRWLQHPMMILGAESSDESQLLRDILADYTGTDLLNFDAASYGFETDVVTALDTLNVPTLVLTGALETDARKRHAREILSRVAGSKEVLLEESGHLSNLTEPATYNRAVREFCLEAEARLPRHDAALLME